MTGLDLTGLSATALTEYAVTESRNVSTEALKAKLQNADKASDDELMEACKSFEAYFLEQIFKEMQKSVDSLKPESEDKSTQTLVDYFKNETLQDICSQSVDMQSNGFAKMLYDNLTRNYDIPTAKNEADS